MAGWSSNPTRPWDRSGSALRGSNSSSRLSIRSRAARATLHAAAPDHQISLTDPDARAMATNGRGTGIVGYNVQTAVDAKHHLLRRSLIQLRRRRMGHCRKITLAPCPLSLTRAEIARPGRAPCRSREAGALARLSLAAGSIPMIPAGRRATLQMRPFLLGLAVASLSASAYAQPGPSGGARDDRGVPGSACRCHPGSSRQV